MRFIKIPRTFLNLKEGTKFIDVLVYAAIAWQYDEEEKRSRIGMRTISEKYNITLLKVEQSVARLKDNGFINYKQIKSENNEYVFNEYTFPEYKDFLMLNPEILTEDLKPKDRGILIYLQLACEYETNCIMETTVEGVANRIGITRQTMSKYLKFFKDNGYMQNRPYPLYRYYYCRYLAKENKIVKADNNEWIL